MVEFVRLGFDIRQAPDEGVVSADALVWPRQEMAYQSALSAGFKENSFQLIQVDSESELERLNEIVRQSKIPAVIAELAAFGLVAKSLPDRGDSSMPEEFSIAVGAISIERYDACDIDGFFSAYDMGKGFLRRERGSSTEELLDACIVAQAANFLVPSHAPFVTVRVRVLRTRSSQ